MKIAPYCLVLCAIACTINLFAAEPEAPPQHVYLVESVISSEEGARWAAAVAETSKAHAGHDHGNSWVAYRMLTGGPDDTVWFFFGFNEMGELDDWKSNRRIVIETLGNEAGREVLADLQLEQPPTDRIISYRREMSRPWTDVRGAPPANLWVVEVQVAPEKQIEYAALWKRLAKAYEAAHPGAAWYSYGNTVGGDRSVHLVLYPFDLFAEVDDWPSRTEVLTKAYGATEAARLSAALDAISETTKSLWHLEPALSQLKTK